jgi:GNAT superfamily N-acetyltransferase
MTVRPATDRDLEAIRPLLEQLMQPDVAVDHAYWDAALRHEGYRAWVAEVDGKVAGFVDLFVLPDVGHGRHIGVINTLVTGHRHRRRGIGARLVREAIDECRRRDAVEVHVWTGFTMRRRSASTERSGSRTARCCWSWRWMNRRSGEGPQRTRRLRRSG